MAKATVKAAAAIEPRIRRGYFESRYGQLHVHNAIPPGGGFDEATSLICLHATPRSGDSLVPLMTLMGGDRSVYAPDLPGYGHSDGPSGPPPSIADYAGAVQDFCDSMRFRQIDLLGCQVGALAAVELALALPRVVRRVVLVGVPAPTEAEKEAFRRAPWPVPPAADGSHLLAEWNRVRESAHAGASVATLARACAEILANGPQAARGLLAAMQYPLAARLPALTQPVLLLRSRDEPGGARVRDLLPKARAVELADLAGSDLFEAAAAALAPVLRDFFKG